jgi:hypothetical protein
MADVAEQGAELKRCSFCCPSDSIGAWIDLAGEGKWLRSASGRLLSVAVTGRERFSGDQNQRKYLSTMEPRKVEIGAEALLRISREFGKTIEWLPTR